MLREIEVMKYNIHYSNIAITKGKSGNIPCRKQYAFGISSDFVTIPDIDS